jgi:hypothetical protein
MGLFGLFRRDKKKEGLLELQGIVSGKQYNKLVMTEKQLIDAATRAAQRDIEIIQDCMRIIKETKKPDTFFSRLDLFVVTAERLRIYEKHLRFSVSPSAAYGQLWDDYQECIGQFLVRYFMDVFDQAAKLKTDRAKLNKYQKFYDSLQPYYEQMNAENIDYIETKYRAYTRRLKA